MSLDESRSCPDPEMLTAFIDGTLRPTERDVVGAHVAECNTCLWVVREATQYLRADRVAAAPSRWRYLSIAAALVVAVAGAWLILRDRSDAVTRMAAAVRQSGVRTFEGRLDRFPHVRYTSTRSLTAAATAVAAAARGVLDETPTPKTAAQWHRRGVAALLADRIELAVHDLAAAVRLAPRSASYRNDLSAARITLGTTRHDLQELRLALADAEEALRLDPRLEPAVFNRALALDHLGARAEAREAYRRYLEIDSVSPWADEARWRMNRL